MNELRSRRSSKIEDLDSPSDLKKLDLHLVKKTTTAHLSTKTLQIEEELAYDEVAVTLEESDYQKSADNSTIPSLSGSVTPASVLDGRLANFGVVTPGIYRSAWPASDTYDFVKSLNLKTIVTLVQREVEDTAYTAFLGLHGIKQYVIDMKGTKKQAIPVEMMKTILRLVLDKSNHPVLIHCNHGRHRTGCAVGVIRKIYGWDTQTILSEYLSFAHPKPRETDVRYLETVDPSLFLQEPSPEALPRRKTFLRTLIFTFIGTLIWLLTGFKFGNAMDRRHQG
ncbi:hypothetical protein jhhlp_005636 [Lomentospora prolificans]|uniref:Tyrosine specific protein phosphatases domain-containing protein n=1 Tax=Lomentospora prolificans TaxID=41688 RepID=A0A2N3N3P9_9PEZI|nr:hypothetical protein jhhlp_005636 [Lomentospora prolificans]